MVLLELSPGFSSLAKEFLLSYALYHNGNFLVFVKVLKRSEELCVVPSEMDSSCCLFPFHREILAKTVMDVCECTFF